jgi:putative peptidoglycan lipid II flippase
MTAAEDHGVAADDPGAAVSETRGFSLQATSRSALILTGGAAAAQLLGIVRELFLAAQIGVSVELDAFLIALVLPTTLGNVITTGTVTALVPAYLGVRAGDDRRKALEFVGGILAWVVLAGLAVTVRLELLAGTAIAIAGPGLGAEPRIRAIGYLQLLAPLAVVVAVSAILYAVGQAEERFATLALANLVGPVVTLATMFILWGRLGLMSVAVGSLIGPIATVAILVASAWKASLLPRLTAHIPRGELMAFVRHAAPLVASGAVLQVNAVADRAIASLLVPGGVSALRYADVLVRAPIGAIAPAWGSAIYPALVRTAGPRAATSLGSAAERSLRLVIAVFVPIAALTAAVAPVAVEVAYGRGAFKAADLALTASLVVAFAPLLAVLMISPVLVGAHNARRRGTILLIGGTLNAILNLVLDVALGATIGVQGVALSSSVTSTAVLLYFGYRLSRAEPDFMVRPIARTFALAVTSAAPPAILIGLIAWGQVVPAGVVPGLAFLAVSGSAGLAAYAGIALLLRLEESRAILEQGRRWIGRIRGRRQMDRPRP